MTNGDVRTPLPPLTEINPLEITVHLADHDRRPWWGSTEVEFSRYRA